MASSTGGSSVKVASGNSCLGCVAFLFIIMVFFFGIRVGNHMFELDVFPPAITWEKVQEDQPVQSPPQAKSEDHSKTE